MKSLDPVVIGALAALAASTAAPAAAAQSQRVKISAASAPHHFGVLDYATGTWRDTTFGPRGIENVVYSNTCSFSGGAFFSPLQDCWDLYEEGRLPGANLAGDPFAQSSPDASQLCDCYLLTSFDIAYCTDVVTPAQGGVGAVAIQVGFLEGANVSGIGGACMNFDLSLSVPNPPSGAPANLGLPPANFGGPHDFFVDLTGTGLPGTGSGGTGFSCWTVTIDLSNAAGGEQVLCANGGDGTFGNGAADLFDIVYSMRGTTAGIGVGSGFLLGGDPGAGAPGAGTFGVPGGLAGCGTGLGAQDLQWINVDGSMVGGFNGSPACPGLGSACYFFGGWPLSPFADTYLLMRSSGCVVDGAGWSVYCTAKASSSGCLATMSANQPSSMSPVSGAGDFVVTMSGAEGQRSGILFSANTAVAAMPFLGGTLCMQPPLIREPALFTGGTVGACDGSFGTVVNDGIGFPPGGYGFDAGPGGTSFVQGWYRDPALMDGFDVALSDAIQLNWQ